MAFMKEEGTVLLSYLSSHDPTITQEEQCRSERFIV